MDEETKTCYACHQTKPRTEFYRNRSRHDGLQSKCKECTAQYQRSPHGNEIHRRAYRRYRQSPAGVASRLKYQKTDKCKTNNIESQRRQRVASRARFRATDAANNAIREGRLCPCPCEVCGLAPAKVNGRQAIEAHHDDYSKPLDVRWLCRKHHLEVHGKMHHAGGLICLK